MQIGWEELYTSVHVLWPSIIPQGFFAFGEYPQGLVRIFIPIPIDLDLHNDDANLELNVV